MCLIIHAEPKYRISETLMDDFAKRNDDGFGIMWVENNQINTRKFGPTEMDKLYPTYLSVQDKEHFIHLRMRTHGDTNVAMAHPYYCGYGIWLMHNGILDTQGDDTTKSDTWYFVNHVLNPLFKMTTNPHTMMRSKAFANIMLKFLGHNNRVVLGDRGGYVTFNSQAWHNITNENTGVTGMLVSNTYAWSSSSFGQPVTVYTNQRSQGTLPLVVGGTSTTTSTASGVDNPAFEKALLDWFFLLGRKWYMDKYGHIYKRDAKGFTRRPDLDEKDQFWNSLNADTVINAGVWMAEQNNVDTEVEAANDDLNDADTVIIDVQEIETLPTSIVVPETIDPTTGEIGQLVINWSAMGKEDISKYLVQYPSRAAEAIYHLTHNKQ